MTPEAFIASHPEFRSGGALVAGFIAQATARVDATIFGTQTEAAIGWLTAHLLASSPHGRSMRSVDDGENSIYHREFERIRREVTLDMMVI